MLGSESESTSIELYLTIGDIKVNFSTLSHKAGSIMNYLCGRFLHGFLFFSQICVNDDLVAKKFAYYNRESEEISWLDEVDRLPVMLSRSILAQKPAAQTEPAPAEQDQRPAEGRSFNGSGPGELTCLCPLPHHIFKVTVCGAHVSPCLLPSPLMSSSVMSQGRACDWLTAPSLLQVSSSAH